MFKSLAKDIALYGFADFVVKIIAFFTFPIFAHLLSVSDYGVLSFAGIIAGFIGMFLTLGLNNAIQRFYFDSSFNENNRPILVSTGYIIMGVWATVITALSILIAYLFRDYTQEKYQLPFSYISLALLTNIPLVLLGYSNDTIRLHFKPRNFLILAFCRNLAGVLLSIVLMKFYGMGLWGYFLANFIGAIVFIPLGIYLTRQDCKMLFDKEIAKTIVKFGYPFVFAGFAYWLFGSMDRWMLGQWSTMEQAGIYSIAFKLGSVLLFINSAFGQAWSPVAIKIMRDQPNDYKTLFSRLFTYWFATLILIGAITCFFAIEFFHLFTPEPYWSAANTTIWVTIGLIINGTTQLTAIGISISKRTKFFTYIAWVTALVNFLINMWLIPIWGANGSAIATCITYLVLSGGYLIVSQKVHWMPLEKGKLLILCFFLIGVTGLSLYLNNLAWTPLILSIKIIAIASIVAVFLIFKIIDLKDLKKIFKKNHE